MSKELTVKLETKLISDTETEEKIKAFTNALNELPRNVSLNFAININGNEGETPLVVNLADILIDQVKRHFGKN